MEITQVSRVNVQALDDVERFVDAAQHLKAVSQQRHDLMLRDSRRLAALERLITTYTEQCGALVKSHPRLAEMWRATQAEVHALMAAGGCDQQVARAAPCVTGARGVLPAESIK